MHADREGYRGVSDLVQATDITDPDFVPHGSAFSLKWSPWVVSEGNKCAILVYLAKNYVGFRRITIKGDWVRGQLPELVVEDKDMTSICTHLSTDAFVEWENSVRWLLKSPWV